MIRADCMLKDVTLTDFKFTVPVEEKKKVLDMILSNPVLDGINIQYDLKKPFAILKEMKGNDEWRTRVDSNHRPTA